MSFELKLSTGCISNEGAILAIDDVSNWAESTLGDRTQYGVFLMGFFRLTADKEEIGVTPDEPLTDTTWNASTNDDGRYSFNAYAFPTVAAVTVPAEGDLAVDTDNLLKQYDNTDGIWVEVDVNDHLASAHYSTVLEVPFLARAFAYKNQLNLQYIAQVKNDMAHGAEQNKLYYKRTDLDYYNALISGAGYNFSLGLYNNFYDIVNNLDDIRVNQQIS